jgi:hypothetical protein
MMIASVELYRTLGENVGLGTGWHEVGPLRLASSGERMEESRARRGSAPRRVSALETDSGTLENAVRRLVGALGRQKNWCKGPIVQGTEEELEPDRARIRVTRRGLRRPPLLPKRRE